MAGFGFSGSGKQGGRRQNMGIQFIKSEDTLNENESSPLTMTEESAGAETSSDSYRDAPAACNNQSFGPNDNGFASEGKSRLDNYPASDFGLSFVKSGDMYSSSSSRLGGGGEYRMPGSVELNKGDSKPTAASSSCAMVPDAKPLMSKEEYLAAWRAEKDPLIMKFRKLAYEVVALKTDRPNAKDKIHSAANRVPIRIEFNTEPVMAGKNTRSFLCYVFMDGVTVACGQGAKIKDAKTNAYEIALQKVLTPYLRILELESKELQVSFEPFKCPPPTKLTKVSDAKFAAIRPPSAPLVRASGSKEIASLHKETNLEAAGLKRRFNEFKPLENFVIIEPLVTIPDCNAVHTLRRSADFNHMLLEYEYFFKGESARCILKIENQVLADVNGVSKVAAKNVAAVQALKKMKNICWVIKTKQPADSDTKISKEEMLSELNEHSDVIGQDNIGNQLLRKMGWSGGGVGKDGSGIAEPVSLKSALNREGLGLSTAKGITDDFKKRVREVIENYASSSNQEDLVFSSDFALDERQIIHDECRKLNLRSKSRGKGNNRYLCVRRKRSANQLFDHIMSCGGETARYILMPPGSDVGTEPQLNVTGPCSSQTSAESTPGQDTESFKGHEFVPLMRMTGFKGPNTLNLTSNDSLLGNPSNQLERQEMQNMNSHSAFGKQNTDEDNGFGTQNREIDMRMQNMGNYKQQSGTGKIRNGGGMGMQNVSNVDERNGRMSMGNQQRLASGNGMGYGIQNIDNNLSQTFGMQNMSSTNQQLMAKQNRGNTYQTERQSWGTDQSFRGRNRYSGREVANYRYGRGRGNMRNEQQRADQWNGSNGSGHWDRMGNQWGRSSDFENVQSNSWNRGPRQGGWGSQHMGNYR